MKKFDVIIIGASIAGLTLAYLLKKSNKSILVVERKKIYYQNKLCGGLLSKKSYDLLDSIYGIDVEQLRIQKNDHFIIENNNQKIRFDLETYSVPRRELDKYIIDKFLNIGGQIMDECEFEDLDVNNHRIEIKKEKYYFDYLVGADGIFSNVRKYITEKYQSTNFAYEMHIISQKKRELTISFFDNFDGYGWLIPNHRGARIGLGNIKGSVKIENTFYKYIDKLQLRPQFVRNAYLPTGDDILLNYKNIFFIGDAAGLISPITGEGIYYALLSAKILSTNLNKKYKLKMLPTLLKIKIELFYKKYVYNIKIRNKLFSKSDNYIIKKILIIFAKKLL